MLQAVDSFEVHQHPGVRCARRRGDSRSILKGSKMTIAIAFIGLFALAIAILKVAEVVAKYIGGRRYGVIGDKG